MKIEYNHPITGEKCEFDCPEAKYIDGYRTHHPVIVWKTGCIDQEDWFYRFLDQYDGPIVARYDRSSQDIWNDIEVPNISHVILLSFEQWKVNNDRICGYAKLPSYTMRSMIRDLGFDNPENITWRKTKEQQEADELERQEFEEQEKQEKEEQKKQEKEEQEKYEEMLRRIAQHEQFQREEREQREQKEEQEQEQRKSEWELQKRHEERDLQERTWDMWKKHRWD